MKTINRYIPELVYQKIQTLNYKNVEHLYIICDMLTRISIYRKEDTDYSNDFKDIPLTYFTDIISDKLNYYAALNFLKDEKIVECDGIFSKIGGKALGYRFKDVLISKMTTVCVERPTIFKRIIKNINDEKNQVNNKYKPYKEHFLNTFKIDYNNALKYLNEWYDDSLERLKEDDNINNLSLSSYVVGNSVGNTNKMVFMDGFIKLNNKYNALFMSISAINDGHLFFRKNKTNGRIDTNLTNLKSELKQFITSDNELVQLDIANSQPYLLSIIINNLSLSSYVVGNSIGNTNKMVFDAELKLYTKLVEDGKFYQYVIVQYFKQYGIYLSKKEIKPMMFCVFYSRNTTCGKEKAFFKKLFPNIMEWVNKQKENKHNELAIRMQKIESEICIDIICDKLNERNIKYYTIHDAWIVDKKDVALTESIIKKCFQEKYKSIPTITPEKIN